MLTKKRELERKFEVEMEMLKNQHEVELLSFQQRAEETRQVERDKFEIELKKEKTTNHELREQVKELQSQRSTNEINLLHEELMNTKLTYENQIYNLGQDLENAKIALDNSKEKEDRNKNMAGLFEEEMSTLKYQIEEKDILINDLQTRLDNAEITAQKVNRYTEEDLTAKLDELRTQLTTEYKQSLESANLQWRKKLEEYGDVESDKISRGNDEDKMKLQDDTSELKVQLQEANELQEEQNKILEMQEKEMEELRESNKEFEERYNKLYSEMETKWMDTLNESEIIKKIKNHYEFEIERLHGQLEDLEVENGNLKTELDLMTNDFDGGHSRVHSSSRRASISARVDIKTEIEQYKVTIATLERDLQHALNQNERLKLENSVQKNVRSVDDCKVNEIQAVNEQVEKLKEERETLIVERDDFRCKVEESKKERMKLEKDLKNQSERMKSVEKDMQVKIKEITSNHETVVKNFEKRISDSMASVEEAKLKYEEPYNHVKNLNEEHKRREQELERRVEELQEKESVLSKRCEVSDAKILTLEEKLHKAQIEKDNDLMKLTAKEKHALDAKIIELETKLAEGKVASEALKAKYEKTRSENNVKALKIDEITKALDEMKNAFENAGSKNQEQKNEEIEKLKQEYEEIARKNMAKDETIFEMERSHQKLKKDFDELQREKEMYDSNMKKMKTKEKVINELNALSLNEITTNEKMTMTTGLQKIEGNFHKSEIEIKTKDDHQKILDNYSEKLSTLEHLETERVRLQKQITAFEKTVTLREREKKSLQEKVRLLEEVDKEHKKEIISLKEKCESYDSKNAELEKNVFELRDIKDTLNIYTARNNDLSTTIQEITKEKNELAAKHSQLIGEHVKLQDTLKHSQGRHEAEEVQKSSVYERKLVTVQTKLEEKSRVLNETKRHYEQLKENQKALKDEITANESKCFELQGIIKESLESLKHVKDERDDLKVTLRQLEEKNDKDCARLKEINLKINEENTILKQQLHEATASFEEKEAALQDELTKQREEIKETQSDSKSIHKRAKKNDKNMEEMRNEAIKISEENHALKKKLDDLEIGISKEKEDKYKVEKLKDQFRFEVQNLQEKLSKELEKISMLQDEKSRQEEERIKENNKLLTAMKEYEVNNDQLISDISKASDVLKRTKEKYNRLKEKYNRLAKKHTELTHEKLNKSDAQVGPDTSVDLSSIVEDLQRSKDSAEEANLKLRMELDAVREEIGRSEYQIKSVRKANVVLMKQSRCLYHESEKQKRDDEEKTRELQKYRVMTETLQEEKNTWQKEREILSEQVKTLSEKSTMLKQKNDEYLMAKNKTEIQLGEKFRECAFHSRQLEKMTSENSFLHEHDRKRQEEFNFLRMTSLRKMDEKQDFLDSFERTSTTDKLFNSLALRDVGRTSTDAKDTFVEEMTPQVFNNSLSSPTKVVEGEIKNSSSNPIPSNNKDTNLHVTRNIINNDFGTEKYLGKTYWDTLEFLKKK